MSTWLTEQDWRELGDNRPELQSLTLNVAFLNEIKQDNGRPDQVVNELKKLLSSKVPIEAALLFSTLCRLRDELEVHFALEEFYGYFQSARLTHPHISVRAEDLKSQHETIYLDLCELVELAESVLYRESPMSKTWSAIRAGFHSFVQILDQHEREEAELMMRLCNDDIGNGD